MYFSDYLYLQGLKRQSGTNFLVKGNNIILFSHLGAKTQ